MPISHAKRTRNKVENASEGGSGIGGKVPMEKMVQAARIWLDIEQERGPESKVPASTVAKRLSLSVAPEWLATERFTRILEVERFRRRVLQLKALPELTGLIQNVIDLGLVEAQKRLVLSPGEIPNSTLFGDILFKLPKMVQDFTAGDRPVKAGDIFISVAKEINLIADPRVKEQVRKQLMSGLQGIAEAVNGVAPEDANADTGNQSLGGTDLSVRPGVLQLAPSEVQDAAGTSFADTELWSDPALD